MPSNDKVSALDVAQSAFDKTYAMSAKFQQSCWSPEAIKLLSIEILGFMSVALILCSLLLWRSNATSQYILKVFGVLIIIGFSALLLVVGYSDSQLTPIVGLFGAIAGYLLGKDTGRNNP